jgi:hypothetical protein
LNVLYVFTRTLSASLVFLQEGGGVGEVGLYKLAELGFFLLAGGVVDGLEHEVAGLSDLLRGGGGVGQVQGVFAHDLSQAVAEIGQVGRSGVIQRDPGAGETVTGVGGGVQATLQLANLALVGVYIAEAGGVGGV